MSVTSTSIFSYLKLIRTPNLLIIVLAQYFAAIFLLGTSTTWQNYLFDKNLFLISLSTVIIAAAGYIINDYFDIKIDYVNKPHRVIVGRDIKRRHAIAAHTLLNAAAILIGLIVHPIIALANFFSAALLWWYSFKLKNKPLIGNLIVALLTALCLLLLVFYYRSGERIIMMYAVFAFGLTLIREIIKDAEDLEGDSDYGRKTIPIVWGIKKSKALLLFLNLGFILGLYLITRQLNNKLINIYFYLFLAAMMVFMVKIIFSGSKKDFKALSTFCKFLMLLGILSMMFI